MSERQAFIQSVVEELTPAAPKIVTYHNGTLIAFRNGDGDRVATIASIPMDCSYKTIVGMLKSMASK